MNGMRQTLYNIAVITLCSGMLEMLSNSGKLKKYTSYALSLIVTLSLLQPLSNIISDLPSKLDIDEGISGAKEDERDLRLKSALEEAIELDISSNLKLPQDSFLTEIQIQNQNGEITVSSVTIKVTDSRYFRYCERLEAYLNVNYGCEITVTQTFKEK